MRHPGNDVTGAAATEPAQLPSSRLVRLLGRAPEAWTVDDLAGLPARLRLDR